MRRCPFAGCERRLPFSRFACRPHWFSLRLWERKQISVAYRLWLAGRIDLQELRRRQQEVLGERGRAAQEVQA